MTPTPTIETAKYILYHGDCLEVMPALPAQSVDAIVTDPPYGLGFMGQDWDRGVPGVHFWTEALRVAMPGAHLLAFGGTRTFHRLACAIEDAGWEIRDTIMWVYGSGFPKSLDVSKAIDKAAGAAREVVRVVKKTHIGGEHSGEAWARPSHYNADGSPVRKMNVTAPATEAAKQWDGWGTALKPSWEPIIVARKPLDGTVAANVLEWGTGAINVDGCRIDTGDDTGRNKNGVIGDTGILSGLGGHESHGHPAGRWPANLVHDGSDEVTRLFPDTGRSCGGDGSKFGSSVFWGEGAGAITGYGDTGSAARFFYCAKASKEDRDDGLINSRRVGTLRGALDGSLMTGAGNPRNTARGNHHPTVKPTDLMRWLVRLVTPPGGVVFDPFMGSGSTGKAALLEGVRFIGIELEPNYLQIARQRIDAAEVVARNAAGDLTPTARERASGQLSLLDYEA